MYPSERWWGRAGRTEGRQQRHAPLFARATVSQWHFPEEAVYPRDERLRSIRKQAGWMGKQCWELEGSAPYLLEVEPWKAGSWDPGGEGWMGIGAAPG